MSYTTLTYDVVDRVATVTLDRPDRRNAYTRTMGLELSDAYARSDADDQVRAVVLTGRPPAFCAGADLEDGEDTFTSTGEDFSAAGVRTPAFSLSKPVLAAVNGHAVGIGLTLALQCDIRILADSAKYGVVQVRRGVLGDAYVHWVLPRLVGISRAAEILLTGATFDGQQALRLGLGSRALPAEEVLPAAQRLAREIAVQTAPLSVAASKRLLWSSFEKDAHEVEHAETDLHRSLMGHDDAREGMRAFLGNRDPEWTGRPSTWSH